MQITKKNIRYQPLEGQESPNHPFPFRQPGDSNKEWGCPLMGVIHFQSNPMKGPKVLMLIGPIGLPIGSEGHQFHRVIVSLLFFVVSKFPI
jgi:hypothetical protein